MFKSVSKKLYFLSACLLFTICLNAQTKNVLSGKIIDSTSGKPIDYATITLATVAGKVLNGTTTDSTGNFKVSDIDTGLYNVSFEFIGYKKKVLKNIDINSSEKNVGTISLQKFETTLKDVTVTSQTKLIDNRIDKLVFNAENDLTSQGGVATDILKKIPQVSVDADGNVELAGSGGVRFLINGKPSSAFGSNVADVLQSIPASQIKSIEVITNPGAKYDAQGLGGIINIILKQTKVNGVSSNISLSAGTRIENGSFNITARHANFGVNAFVSGNTRLTAATPFASDRTSIDTVAKEIALLHQDGSTNTNRHGLESGIGFDWTIKKYNNFSGNVNYNRFGNKNDGIINQQQKIVSFDSTTNSDVASLNNSANSFTFYSTDASLNYKRTFKKEDQSLEINLNSSFGNISIASDNYQNLLPQDSLFYGINNNNFGKENEKELEIDYTQPFSKNVIFDAGADITFDDITSTSHVYALQPDDKIYLYDSSLSNYLSYHQKVYAAYAEISFPVAHLFDAKIGSRYERTEINSFYSDATEQIKNPGYNTLVPSIYFLRKLNDEQSIKLSYSKRIERPDYRDLNPFINTTDPQNITAGNPYLKPEIGNRIELSYNYDFNNSSSLNITAFYRENHDDIQPYTAYYSELTIGDSVYKNVSVSTRENIGLEKNAGISLFGNVELTDKFTLRTNLFFFRRHIINGIDSGRNPTSFNYRINLNASYKFTNTFSAEFFGNFNSARNELQGKYPSFTTYTIAARKQFWNKKGSLALTATNLFNEYVNQPTIIYGTNFTTNSIRKIPFRSIGLNFTWKFGKLDFKKDKDENNNNNNIPVPSEN
ncbi:MAG: TonB-dependent receptor [Parafilimonas sp.]